MTTTTQVNSLFLVTLTLAEITRFKFGASSSLTHPSIERNARKQFADLVGIPAKSQPKVFLRELKRVHSENQLSDKFEATLKRFGLDANSF